MGGGTRNSQSKSSNWSGYPKRRCANIGCKKRARHTLEENGKAYCMFCFNNYTIQELIDSAVVGNIIHNYKKEVTR